jgi:hypothetical protein
MIAGILRILAAGMIAALTAGCVTGGDPAAPELRTAPASVAAPIAFEPVTGIPEERTAVLADELVSGSVSGGLTVVPRQARDARFRLKGYFSAARSGSSTRITYVWDIFDRDENRVHRIGGTESVEAGLPDPWQAVTDDALRRIARRTVEDLRAWLGQGAPSAGGEANIMPSSPTALAEDRSDAIIPAAFPGPGSAFAIAAPPATAAPVNPARTARSAAGPRVYINPVSGAAADGGAALARALASRLAADGAVGTSHPAEADYVVTGEATVGPAQSGRQTVAIIWSVAAPDGGRLGTVRQVSHVRAGALDDGWGAAALRAAGAAAPGILALMQNH